MTRSWLLVLAFACGGRQDPAPAPISNTAATPTVPTPQPKTREQRALAALGEFRDKMCKCAAGDADCAKAVSDEMVRWSENQPRNDEPEPVKAPPEAEKIGMELGECMVKAMTPSDPNAGSGTP